MTYADCYSKAIKYGADELTTLRHGDTAKALVKAAVAPVEGTNQRENTPLLALADHFDDNNHPLGNYIRRVAMGEGVEGDALAQSVLGGMHSARPDVNKASLHSDYPVLDNSTEPSVNHKYYKLPDGQHLFHISVDHNRNRRSFLLPVSEDEVTQYIEALKSHDAPQWTKKNIEQIEAVKANPPRESTGFASRLRQATTPLNS
jgi:hypothetical protein